MYTLYFYHFDTSLQTVNQIIPTFIHSFAIPFTRFIRNFDQLDSFTHSQFRPTRFIRSLIRNFDQLYSFAILTNSIHSFTHLQFRPTRFLNVRIDQFDSSSEFRRQSLRATEGSQDSFICTSRHLELRQEVKHSGMTFNLGQGSKFVSFFI